MNHDPSFIIIIINILKILQTYALSCIYAGLNIIPACVHELICIFHVFFFKTVIGYGGC